MRRLVPILALAILSLGVIASCGGSSEPTLTVEEYFAEFDQQIAALVAAQDARAAMPTRTPLPSDTREEERVALAREDRLAYFEYTQDYVNELRAMNPPDELADAHHVYVEAGDALTQHFVGLIRSSSFEDYLVGTENAKTYEEYMAANAALGGPDAAVLLDRMNQGCRELEAAAERHDIEISIGCDDD